MIASAENIGNTTVIVTDIEKSFMSFVGYLEDKNVQNLITTKSLKSFWCGFKS